MFMLCISVICVRQTAVEKASVLGVHVHAIWSIHKSTFIQCSYFCTPASYIVEHGALSEGTIEKLTYLS